MADALDLESSEEIRESSSLSIRNKKFSFVLLPRSLQLVQNPL